MHEGSNPVKDDSKNQQRLRYEKMLKKLRDRDEERMRQPRAPKDGSRAKGAPPRRREWTTDEDEAPSGPKAPRPGRGKAKVPPTNELERGIVVEIQKTRVQLEIAGQVHDVLPHPDLARRASPIAIGDQGLVLMRGATRILTGIAERRSVLSRPDPGRPERERVIAANVDLAVITLAVGPRFLPGLVDRLLIALARGGVKPLVCVNKIDQLAPDDTLAAELRPYRDAGIPVVLTSTVRGDGIDELRAALRGRVVVFVGQSGVGKSSLVNRLDPDCRQQIGAVREDDQKGRHTTTASRLFRLGDGTGIIDTPGVRAFGLWRIVDADVLEAFPELAAVRCRHADCRHDGDDGCAVPALVDDRVIAAARHASYRRILASLRE